MGKTYTSTEEQIIKDNYELYGPKYCAKLLGGSYNENSIWAKAHRMGLRKIGTKKHPSEQKIDPRQFLEIVSSEVAYFLGFFWADGYILSKTWTDERSGRINMSDTISLEIVSEDFNNLKNIFFKLGKWAVNTRKRNINWKETTTMSTNSKDLYDILEKLDYKVKNINDPVKVLEIIPDNLKPDWWRGFFDGDGWLTVGEGNHRYKSLGFCGSYDIPFTSLKKLCDELNIEKYNAFKHKHKIKNHQSTKFGIQNISDITKMINYLLQSKHGLQRKTDKMLRFLEKFQKN